jgi:hypothetical protein
MATATTTAGNSKAWWCLAAATINPFSHHFSTLLQPYILFDNETAGHPLTECPAVMTTSLLSEEMQRKSSFNIIVYNNPA